MAKTNEEQSSWDTETGLLDNYDFVVEEAWYGEDEEADEPSDRIYLFLRGEGTDDEGEIHEEHTERYSTGKNWEVVSGGKAVENAAGRKLFNQNAGVGRLINALVALGKSEAKFLQTRGIPTKAKTFRGLKMHMVNRVVSEWVNDDGEDVKWYLNLPTSLKTKGGKKTKSKSKGGQGKANRSTTKEKKTSKKGAKTSGLRAEIATFTEQFKVDEHDEFVDQVLDTDVFANADKIMDDDELHAEVLDPNSDLWNNSH